MNLDLKLAHRFLGILLSAVIAGCSGATAPAGTTIPAEHPAETPTLIPPTRTPPPTFTLTPTKTPTRVEKQKHTLLMAHYMPWYQTPAVSGYWGYHWTMNHFDPTRTDANGRVEMASHFTPLTGVYDSSDEALLEYQVLLMKLSGIDGVIVDWYGNEDFWDYAALNQATQKLFEIIKNAGLRFAICYEDQTIKHMVDNKHLDAAAVIPFGQGVMRYMQQNWFGDPAYLKADGRPVLFIFGPQYFKSDADWKTLFSVLDTPPLFITLDNTLGSAATSSYPWVPMWASSSGVLTQAALKSYLDAFYAKAERQGYMVGGAFPGFYDIYKEAGVGSGYGYLDARDGETFRDTLQSALDHNPDVVQLITWNDYGEGTGIEPTDEFGYRYLEMVQDARRTHIEPGFSHTAADLQLPLKLYKLRKQYAEDAGVNADLDKVFAAIISGDLEAAAQIIALYP